LEATVAAVREAQARQRAALSNRPPLQMKRMKQKINVGIIGLGTVGSGAFRILRDNAELIRHRVGVPVEVTKIAVRDATRDRGVAIPAGVLTTNPSQVIDDPNIDIVQASVYGAVPVTPSKISPEPGYAAP